MDVPIITCPQWNAKPAKAPPVYVPAPVRIIFHHTAGHHREITRPANESEAEAIRYALDIQAFHMRPVSQGGRGWNDSGHNFLVTRGGQVLQGRWHTVTALQHRRMVESAHCPGQNGQVGIEHEHAGGEPMTEAQRQASARLQAWIAARLGHTLPLPVAPHRTFFATSCPGNLVSEIPRIRRLAGQMLAGT